MIPLDQAALEIATLLSYLCEFIGIAIEKAREMWMIKVAGQGSALWKQADCIEFGATSPLQQVPGQPGLHSGILFQ